jgi:hypothetical protein
MSKNMTTVDKQQLKDDPDPMCLVCDGEGFICVAEADETEHGFAVLEFCKCWAGRNSRHYRRRVPRTN